MKKLPEYTFHIFSGNFFFSVKSVSVFLSVSVRPFLIPLSGKLFLKITYFPCVKKYIVKEKSNFLKNIKDILKNTYITQVNIFFHPRLKLGSSILIFHSLIFHGDLLFLLEPKIRLKN